jgi:hypothetical protein
MLSDLIRGWVPVRVKKTRQNKDWAFQVLIQSEPNRRQTRMGIPEARMGIVTLPFASLGWRD